MTDGYAVKAVLHNHTNLGHAVLTPQELVAVARSRGLAALAITEHDNLEVAGPGCSAFATPPCSA